ncbi:MAG: class I SAM-dependent methyltransferase [Elusimicrobiota bacterium]
MKSSEHVSRMYSEYAPFPGRFIRLLEEKNTTVKKFYTHLALKREFSHKSAYRIMQTRFRENCPNPGTRIRILDAGCGTGEKTLHCGSAFRLAEVTGIDFSEKSIHYARLLKEHFRIGNIDFKQTDIINDNIFKLGKFDLVQCRGVLHHMDNPKKALRRISELMNTGAVMWLFLYSNYGNRYLETNIRKGIRRIYPDDRNLVKRADLYKKLSYYSKPGLPHTVFSYFEPDKKLLRSLWDAVKDKGYDYYTRTGNTMVYDGFAHPIAENYNPDKIRSLLEGTGLIIADYYYEPYNSADLDTVRANDPTKDMFERMRNEELIINPSFYNLILRKS